MCITGTVRRSEIERRVFSVCIHCMHHPSNGGEQEQLYVQFVILEVLLLIPLKM